MSLISDALKKAQDKREPEKTEISASYLSPDKDIALTAKKPSSFTLSRVLFFLLIAAALSLGAYYLYVTAFAPEISKVIPSQETVNSPIGESAVSKLKESLSQVKVFAPKIETEPIVEGSPVLTGVMYVGSAPQAIINGTVLNEGDTIEGYTVASIFPNKVVLYKDGRNTELHLQ